MICAVCGTTNEAGARFCYRCGSALAAETSAPAAQPEQRSTPAFGSPVLDVDASNARVYDVPADVNAYQSENVSTSSSYQMPASGTPNYNYSGAPSNYPGYVNSLPQQSNNALIALIMGILSFLFLPLVGAIVAIVLGRNARREIQQSGGRLTGDGMALAGIVLGWINIAVIVIPVCFGLGLVVLLGGANSF